MSDLKTAPDSKLFALLKEDSQIAYTEIFDRYQAMLYVYAYKIVKDEDEAEDIVQDTFFYLWDKRASINLNSSLASYLYATVRYKFFNHLDHKKVRADYSSSMQNFVDKGEFMTDDYIREKELTKSVEALVSLLPPKMREIFELSRKAHLSHKEIAQKLDISEKTVKNQVNNALKQLRFKLSVFSLVFLLPYIYKIF